ncbi:MAG TPA: efflux RND transporter periplasmic adaptor subunit [Gammaproteobacteria bacterium]
MHTTIRSFLTTLGVILNLTNTVTAAELPFDLHTANYQTYPKYQTFDGAIEAIRRATVSSETSGRISEINFDVDDFVEQGKVLVRITDAATRARLSGVEANVSETEAQYNIALSEFTRIKEVFARQLVSQSAYDQAEAELKAAAQRRSAAQAAVKEVLEQLKYTVVKAPYSGIVAERHVELGEMAKVGQPLFTGFSLNALRAVTHVPQSIVNQIRSATQATILIAADGQEALHSSMITVYPEADPVTHAYKVRIKLPSVPKGINPGYMVKIQFTTGEEQKMRIPRQAIVQRSELQAVYVLKDRQIALRQIRLGRENTDNTVDILAGLEPGDTIALDPVRAGVYLKEQAQQ